MGEESLLETPLDKVEPYLLFKEALLSKSPFIGSCTQYQQYLEMQQEQPQLYSSLTGNLSPEEQNTIQQAVQQADALVANAEAAAAAAASGQVPGVVVNGAA